MEVCKKTLLTAKMLVSTSEGDISAVQLEQDLMKLGEGEIPGEPSSDLMKLADKLCHIITRE